MNCGKLLILSLVLKCEFDCVGFLDVFACCALSVAARAVVLVVFVDVLCVSV